MPRLAIRRAGLRALRSLDPWPQWLLATASGCEFGDAVLRGSPPRSVALGGWGHRHPQASNLGPDDVFAMHNRLALVYAPSSR